MDLDIWQYVVLLGAFALVLGLMIPRKKSDPAPDNAQLVEQALDQFMASSETDHQELVAVVSKAQKEWQQAAAARDHRIAELERRCGSLEQQLAEQQLRFDDRLEKLQAAAVSAASQTQPGTGPQVVAAPELNIRARYAELFQMHEQGKSIESIARKAGLNKGEVQLILQLSRQEERHRV
ncbi:hypothetical protein [Paenibacillus sp. 1P07SE]|uniref:hypothetical protein n=1 Tax=Paenibacillus sp. 1P07SE TaxID=3132209 RepID=UPI0039A66654